MFDSLFTQQEIVAQLLSSICSLLLGIVYGVLGNTKIAIMDGRYRAQIPMKARLVSYEHQ